jgi:hypothetical protein
MEGLWLESSIEDLYQSSVDSFPETTRRQFATDSVKIEHVEWVPFIGMKTLFVKGTARNESKKYEPLMLFKGVKYKIKEGKGVIPLMASDGRKVFLEHISSERDDVLVRCSCKDFFYRFNYYNSLDRSLFGRKRGKYEGKGLWEANPEKAPGMCKHLMKMAKMLRESKLLV